MMTYQAGHLSREIGEGFEKEVARSFEAYAKAGLAYLDFVPVPSRRVFNPKFRISMLVPTGKPPFDIGGYVPRDIVHTFKGVAMVEVADREDADSKMRPMTYKLAVMVGAECKATSKPETSLSIVKSGGDSSGIEQHQLEALALLARMGGISRILWSNGGQIGMLREGGILAAEAIFKASLASEQRGKGKGTHGSRSIKWTSFEPVQVKVIAGVPAVPDWLADERKVAAA